MSPPFLRKSRRANAGGDPLLEAEESGRLIASQKPSIFDHPAGATQRPKTPAF